MSDKKFLTGAYGLGNADQTRSFYNDWSASYDTEIHANGYATPRRCAEALAQFATDKTAPHLDIGCGTGVSGEALKAAGFTNIHGTDLSDKMLAQAKKKEIYQTLTLGNITDPFPFPAGTYTTFSAVGVISPGHAPADTLNGILGKLTQGGLLTFSLNDHALEDTAFMSTISKTLASDTCETLFENYDEHLPGIDLRSTVYVLRRL